MSDQQAKTTIDTQITESSDTATIDPSPDKTKNNDENNDNHDVTPSKPAEQDAPTDNKSDTSKDKDDAVPNPSTTHQESSDIKLTGRLLNFTRLSLRGNQVEEILTKTKAKLGKQTQTKLPVVISCEDELDLEKLWEGLWAIGLQPIGIVTGNLNQQAKKLNIAIFPADGERIDSKSKKDKTKTSSKDTPLPSNQQENILLINTDNSNNLNVRHRKSLAKGDLIHDLILRSGQSINHVGGDLILTKGINAGAEAITDYSLHVYGKAEGRLVAGATGDKNAKIFCLKFNPSLVAVAGTYCLKESIPSEFLNQAVQVSYEEEKGLVFSLMT